MKKNYVSPKMEVIHIKQGNVVMTSGCPYDTPSCGDCPDEITG